mgnify:CR=1 FL=1
MEKLPACIENFQWIRILLLFLGNSCCLVFLLNFNLYALKQVNLDNKTLFHSWSFGKINYQLFGIGLFVIILGYIIMATGETEDIQSVKIAPLILMIGYCVFIPVSILVKPKDKA